MENYFQTYIKRDVRNLFPGLNINNYQRFVSMLSSSSGQILNFSEFARSLDVSQPTAKLYFDIAHGTFVWRMIQSYQKSVKKRIVKMPKGHMRDTGLLNYLLSISSVDAFYASPLSGRIWETFIIEEIIKGFKNLGILFELYYYRTSNKAEVDLVLEGDFGLIPVEIKFGAVTLHKNLHALESFIKDYGARIGLVINNASETAWLSKTILQIPASYL
jgi:predicted AAA+ superfamily ATPase